MIEFKPTCDGQSADLTADEARAEYWREARDAVRSLAAAVAPSPGRPSPGGEPAGLPPGNRFACDFIVNGRPADYAMLGRAIRLQRLRSRRQSL